MSLDTLYAEISVASASGGVPIVGSATSVSSGGSSGMNLPSGAVSFAFAIVTIRAHDSRASCDPP